MLHLAYLALNEFYSKKERLPEVNDMNDANEMLEISKMIYSLSKDKKRDWAIGLNENLDELYVIYLSVWSKLNLAPICSYLGGIVAQEIIKITGKFTPFNQWYYFDFFYLLKKDHKKKIYAPSKEDLENRYFDQISIFGKEIQEKFNNLYLFIIGCGALGTEFLKNFSLLGISTGDGKISVTDDDIIEVSNLNRQLLFKRENVGEFKSKIAKDMIKTINPHVNCIDKQLKIDESSEEILNDEFYKNQDIIFTCVDNIETRIYVDKKITLLNKIHIDSGTLGTKAHCQIIIPKLTSNFGDKEDFENEIALCTLHNFPSQIEHCIDWGKIKFGDYFNINIKILNNLLFNFEDEIENINRSFSEKIVLEKIIFLNKLIENLLNDVPEDFILFAIEEFNLNFNKKIQELLIKYPFDFQNRDGSRFWIGAKRPPNPIIPDLNVKNHFLFISAFCKLIYSSAENLKLNSLKNFDDLVYLKKLTSNVLNEKLENLENDKIVNNLQNLKNLDKIDKDLLNKQIENLRLNIDRLKLLIKKEIKENVNSSNLINSNSMNNYLKDGGTVDDNTKKLIKRKSNRNSLLNFFKNYNNNTQNQDHEFYNFFTPLEFEKDNDFNQHVNFICACSNIRAQNYRIKECDFIKAKLIAGRIIPAIASTTATITGFAAAQLYSICNDLNKIELENIRNAFINLGKADIILTETFPNYTFNKTFKKAKNNYVIIPDTWSVWDYIELHEKIKTPKDLYGYFEKNYNVKIRKIIFNQKFLYEYNTLNYEK